VWERLWRWRRRNRAVAGLVAAVALLLLVVAVGGLVLSLHLAAALEQSEGDRNQALAAQREKTEKLALAHYERGRAGRLSRQMGQRLDSLAALAEAARIRPDGQLRDEAIAALTLPDLRYGPAWEAGPAPSESPRAFDGLYRVSAQAQKSGALEVRSIPENRLIQRIDPGGATQALWLSSDGRYLAQLDTDRAVRVWRVADGQRVLRGEPQRCDCVAFSPDSRHLALGWGLRVFCFDLTTGQESSRWALPPWPPAPVVGADLVPASVVHTLAFHPDNRTLAVGYTRSPFVSVYDSANAAHVADLPEDRRSLATVAWHPDGRLAVAGSDPGIDLWDVAARRKLATLEGHPDMVTALTFHPDGELLASLSLHGVLRLWHPSSGRLLLQLPLARTARFSVDGRWLGVAWQGRQARLLGVARSKEYRTLVSGLGAGQGRYHKGDISPDGRLLAVGMAEGTRLWDLGSGREVAALPGASHTVFFDRTGPSWALLTSGPDGLQRWPPVGKEAPGQGLEFGRPRQLSPQSGATFARRPDGRTLAAVWEPGGPSQLVDVAGGPAGPQWGLHPDGDLDALSADGQWAASCGWDTDRVWVWDARTGQRVHEWVVGKRTSVFFTPDSRTLVISGRDEYSLWAAGTWQLLRRLPRDRAPYPGWVAFTSDGQLMALELAPGVIHLKEVATGRTVAKLEDPHGDQAGWLGFTPDGTKLVTVARYTCAIHVWDLASIRRELKAIGLDWDWPEFPQRISR
jgi:WD40 repeat protein